MFELIDIENKSVNYETEIIILGDYPLSIFALL